MIRKTLTTRAAVAALLLAFAALPALADSMTPAAPSPASGANATLKTDAQKSHKTASKKVQGPKQVKQTPAKQQQAKQPASGSTSSNLNGNATVSH